MKEHAPNSAAQAAMAKRVCVAKGTASTVHASHEAAGRAHAGNHGHELLKRFTLVPCDDGSSRTSSKGFSTAALHGSSGTVLKLDAISVQKRDSHGVVTRGELVTVSSEGRSQKSDLQL